LVGFTLKIHKIGGAGEGIGHRCGGRLIRGDSTGLMTQESQKNKIQKNKIEKITIINFRINVTYRDVGGNSDSRLSVSFVAIRSSLLQGLCIIIFNVHYS